MTSNIDNVQLSMDSAIVNTKCSGSRVTVDIVNYYDDVECACYLYSKNKVISKSSYRKNNKHSFPVNNCNELRCKVFFRSKKNSEIKLTKFYDVINDEPEQDTTFSTQYEINNNILNCIDAVQCEIVNTKSNTVELYEEHGFKPRADCVPYPLQLPISWLEDPFDDRNWMFQLHGWRMLDSYLLRAFVEDLKYVADIINDWVQFEKKNDSKWLWYDMSTGLRALKITLYLKVCHDKQLNHNIVDIDYLLHEHFKHLSNPNELNPGNHGLFQLHGLKSLIYIISDRSNSAFSMLSLKKYANEKMSNLIVAQLGTDGVHTEDSPDYHFFAYNKIKNIIDSLWWDDLDENIIQTLKLADHAKSWLVSPDNRCVTIGDSTAGIRKNLPELENWTHLKNGSYISAFVGGYAVVRSLANIELKKSSFLFFQGSFSSQAHKHCDDLSFILQEKGINILIDSGKYGYQQDKYRRYFLSTRAHNTIEVDEVSTPRTVKYAYGSALLDEPKLVDGFWIVRAKVHHKANNYIHERVLFYNPGIEIYVLDKLVNTGQAMSRSVSQWWHFDTSTSLEVGVESVLAKVKNNTKIEITSSTSNGNIVYDTYKGHASGDGLIGWVSKKYLDYEPTSTLRLLTTLDRKTEIITRFKMDSEVSDTPILCLDKNGVTARSIELAEYLSNI